MTAFILSALCLIAAAFNGLIVWGQYKHNNEIAVIPAILVALLVASAIAVPFFYQGMP